MTMEPIEKSWRNTGMLSPGSERLPSKTTRLYRAPQPSTRRRRNPAATNINMSPSNASKRSMASSHANKKDEDADDSSSCSIIETLQAPCLWTEPGEDLHGSGQFRYKVSPSQRAARRQNKRHTKGECIEFDEEASLFTLKTNPAPAGDLSRKSHKHQQHSRKSSKMWWKSAPRSCFWQVLMFTGLCYVVWDSRKKLRSQKQQIMAYDEERAHILEQMTWIDNAAKRVHKKYSSFLSENEINMINHESKSELIESTKNLQVELDVLQHKIRINDREWTHKKFGDKPVQVSLRISENSPLVIELSDDTPHAASTFLQQVGYGLWDRVEFQKVAGSRVIIGATLLSETIPVLEFVEKSRGCKSRGGVAAHQLESSGFHVLILKIHMDDNIPNEKDDVCIGSVLSGLDELENIYSVLPEIRPEDDRDLGMKHSPSELFEENI
jgi:glycerol-3-phosphate cytidylyltransferase-like family protein